MVARVQMGVAAPSRLAPPGAVGILLALLVPVRPVGPSVPVFVPLVVPALVAFLVLLALVVLPVLVLLLPHDPVVCQGEWRWGLLAGPIEVEVAEANPAPVVVLVDVCEAQFDRHVAGVVVGLHVECLGHRVGGSGEFQEDYFPIRSVLHPNGVATLYSVVLPRYQVLYPQLHRVVARFDGGAQHICNAPPGAVGILLAVLEPLPVVGLSVAVPVPVVHPAIVVAFLVLLALVELHVVELLLPLDPVVCQGEWRWGLLARPVEPEALPVDVGAPAVVMDLVQACIYRYLAGVVVGLDVERLGHGLGGCREVQ